MNKHHILEYNNQFDQKHKITEYFYIEKRPVSYTHLDVYKRQGLGTSCIIPFARVVLPAPVSPTSPSVLPV